MIAIRTAEDMVRALDSPLDPELHILLQGHADRLAEWELQDVAVFIIAQPGDTLEAVETAFGGRLVPELISQHHGWIEIVVILSDDGFGLVLFVPIGDGTDPELLATCMRHLGDHA